MTRPAVIDVVAGLIGDSQGRVLLAQRPPGKQLAGLWEFPGGKIDTGESPFQALVRELREELGITVNAARFLVSTRHPVGDRQIRLQAWTVTDWSGEPRGLEGQALAWLSPAAIDTQPMPPADWPIAAALRLPSHYAITPEAGDDLSGFRRQLERLIGHGDQLIQLRCKQLGDDAFAALAEYAARSAERHGTDLLLNDHARLAARLGVGLHLPAARLRDWALGLGDPDDGRDHWLPRGHDGRLDVRAGFDDRATSPARRRRHARGWLAASCHDQAELDLAAHLGCDLATLGPVAATASHPDARPLGWPGFAALSDQARLPVFALGGIGPDDLVTAREHGGLGIAGIRAFWPVG